MKKKLVCIALSLVLIVILSACGGTSATSASAASWPEREIRLIVPFAPGGSTDVVGRIVAAYMAQDLGVPVIVENIPGAGCVIGFNELYTSPADGYTVAMSSTSASPWAIEALAPEKPPFIADDFISVGTATSLSTVGGFVCKAGRWPDFMAFIDDVKANPRRIKLGYQGPGQPNDARVWELEKIAGLDFNIVYYPDSASTQTDLLTGDLDVGILFANRADFAANESFSTLALLGSESPPGYPVQGIPFLADFAEELGFVWEDTTFVQFNTLTQDIILRNDTDPAILARLGECMENISKVQAFKDDILTTGWPMYINGADSTATYKRDRDNLLAFRNSPDYDEFTGKMQR